LHELPEWAHLSQPLHRVHALAHRKVDLGLRRETANAEPGRAIDRGVERGGVEWREENKKKGTGNQKAKTEWQKRIRTSQNV